MNFPTPDFSTPDFSTMNFSTPDFSTPDISTPNLGLKTPGLKSSWLKSPGLKGLGLMLGDEKSGVEMSYNLSLRNIGVEDHLYQKMFLKTLIFTTLYFLKMCPIFAGFFITSDDDMI